MSTYKTLLFLVSMFTFGCAADSSGTASTERKAAAPTATDEQASSSPATDEPGQSSKVAPLPAAAPEHLAAFRAFLNRGYLGKALRMEGSVLDEHPDDPWVWADVGFAMATRPGTEQQGQDLLVKALETAKDPGLRAQILYYYARLEQYENGTRGAHDVVAKALAESPYAVVQRNLEIIDAALPSGMEQVSNDASKAFCDGELNNRSKDRQGTDDRTCVVTRIGETSWARVTWIRQDGAGDMAVFHEWRLVDPAPENPERLRSYFGDPNDPISDIAVCGGQEMLTVSQAYGGEGAVLKAEVMEHEGEAYIVVACEEDRYDSTNDGFTSLEPALFTIVCSLKRGWCGDPYYTREVNYDGSVETAEVVVEPGKILVSKGGESVPHSFP